MARNSLEAELHGTLELIMPLQDGVLEVRLIPSKVAYEEAFGPQGSEGAYSGFPVVSFDQTQRQISIFPLNMYPRPNQPVLPKYDRLREISFVGYEFRLPNDADEIEAALAVLPPYFFKKAEQGLGLPLFLRPIVKAVEALPGVTRLVIAKSGVKGLSGNSYTMTEDEYLKAAAALNAVMLRHQTRSLQEREVYAYNHLVRPLNPETYPEKRVPYDANTIFEILSVVDKSKVKLASADRTAIAKELTKHTAELFKDEPAQLFQLHRQIELVNLDRLINGFGRILKANRSAETRWQKLFDLNPFILSMIFSHPIVVVMKEAAVGLPLITGAGQKVTDFLIKNPGSANAALVEIKTPQEPLSGKIYRGKLDKNPVYGPAKGLVGGVAQVLDQRYRLQKDIATIISNNEELQLKTFHVECILVVGRLPKAMDELKALEIYRNSLKDVRVITFDELLTKIISLRDLLASAPQADGLSETEVEEEMGIDELAAPAGETAANCDVWDDDDDLDNPLG